jgi:dTDP-4-dehydrorhamnose reductase
MKKITVLGATGMLGSMIATELSQKKDIDLHLTVSSEDKLDIAQKAFPGADVSVFNAENPDAVALRGEWILNAIGYIKQHIKDDSPGDCRRAVTINSSLPYWLAETAQAADKKVIQIATDCVFSGKTGSYKENELHDALDVYGKSKSLGEVPGYDNFFNIRCSIIGPEAANRKSLLEWFINQPQNAEVTGFTNHDWNGVTTLHFARLCYGMIQEDITDIPRHQHVIAGEKMNKYEMLLAFAHSYDRKDIKINQGAGRVAVDRTLGTEHPEINERLWKAAGYKTPPSVGEMIAELAEYQHYALKLD